MKVGDPVITKFGPGVLKKLDPPHAQVCLSSGLVVRHALSSLKPGTGASTTLPTVTTPKIQIVNEAPRIGVSTLNALRFGLVPATTIERFTLNSEGLGNWIRSNLPTSGKPCLGEILGPFGSGKSHALQYLRYIARKENFLTAHAELDGNSITLADPAKLWYALSGTLTQPDGKRIEPLSLLLEVALRHGSLTPPRANWPDLLCPFLDYLKAGARNPRFEEALEGLNDMFICSPHLSASELKSRIASILGSSQSLRRVIATRLDERFIDFAVALGGLANIACVLGYKGLVITLDEFEVEVAHATPMARARQWLCLAEIGKLIHGKDDYRKAPLGVFFASVPVEDVDALDEWSTTKSLVLEPFRSEDADGMKRTVKEAYCDTYKLTGETSFDRVDEVLEWVGHAVQTRDVVKAAMADLDSTLGPGPDR